jgi:2-methylcitrate dehydratase PrpD
MNMRERSLSSALAGFVAEASVDALPADVVGNAKRHVLDTLGAALAGAAADETRAALDIALAAGTGRSRAWGTSHALGARDAAFVNGVAAHAFELDDSGGCDHSGAVVLPAAFAALACTTRPVSGREFLLAVVLGYDVGRRVLEACGGYSAHNGRGWHSTMTCGVFGAAAAASRLLGLDAERTAAAIGHAGSFSGGLWNFIHDASQTKRMHTGRAAEGGLLAALLAERGVSGPSQLFADVWGGFFNAFAPDTAEPGALLAGLGETWKIMRCSIKPHASCRSTHAAVDATLALAGDARGRPERVRSVRVRLSGFVDGMCGGRDVSRLASAQMSLPYEIASVLVHGDASLGSYLDACRHDPRIADAMARIVLDVDPSMSDLDEPEVVLTLTNGETRALQVQVPLGDPRNPVSDAALLDKYRQLAGIAIDAAQADALADAVLRIDALPDVRGLERFFVGDADVRAPLH